MVCKYRHAVAAFVMQLATEEKQSTEKESFSKGYNKISTLLLVKFTRK